MSLTERETEVLLKAFLCPKGENAFKIDYKELAKIANLNSADSAKGMFWHAKKKLADGASIPESLTSAGRKRPHNTEDVLYQLVRSDPGRPAFPPQSSPYELAGPDPGALAFNTYQPPTPEFNQYQFVGPDHLDPNFSYNFVGSSPRVPTFPAYQPNPAVSPYTPYQPAPSNLPAPDTSAHGYAINDPSAPTFPTYQPMGLDSPTIPPYQPMGLDSPAIPPYQPMVPNSSASTIPTYESSRFTPSAPAMYQRQPMGPNPTFPTTPTYQNAVLSPQASNISFYNPIAHYPPAPTFYQPQPMGSIPAAPTIPTYSPMVPNAPTQTISYYEPTSHDPAPTLHQHQFMGPNSPGPASSFNQFTEPTLSDSAFPPYQYVNIQDLEQFHHYEEEEEEEEEEEYIPPPPPHPSNAPPQP